MTWFSSGSVDVTEHFATNAFASGIAVAHHSLGGGDDGDTQSAKDFGQAAGVLVDAQAWLADPLHRANGGETVLAAVLEGEHQFSADAFTLFADLGDEALLCSTFAMLRVIREAGILVVS